MSPRWTFKCDEDWLHMLESGASALYFQLHIGAVSLSSSHLTSGIAHRIFVVKSVHDKGH